jgi:hypothetical protein
VQVEELRDALERALKEVDADERSGPLLRAAGLRMRLELTDVPLVLNLTTSEEPGHHLRWSFSDTVDWEPALELEMDSDTASEYLQGRLSLPIAIARGRARSRGRGSTALGFLPKMRLLSEPFRRALRARVPTVAIR